MYILFISLEHIILIYNLWIKYYKVTHTFDLSFAMYKSISSFITVRLVNCNYKCISFMFRIFILIFFIIIIFN